MAPLPKAFPKPNPPSLTSESLNQSSNEFKLEKQGYKQVTTNDGMWDIIPLILDLEASLNFAIGSKRPHRELKTVDKHNSDKYGYESAHTVGFYEPYSRPLFRLVCSIWYRSHGAILKQHCICCHHAAPGLVKPVVYDLQTSHVFTFSGPEDVVSICSHFTSVKLNPLRGYHLPYKSFVSPDFREHVEWQICWLKPTFFFFFSLKAITRIASFIRLRMLWRANVFSRDA